MKTLTKILVVALAALAPWGVGRANEPVHFHPAPEPEDVRAIAGRVSATLDRARDDARRQLDEAVRTWLAPRVDRSWPLPAKMVDAMIRQVRVAPEEKEYGTVYTAVIDADFGSGHRASLIHAHRRDLVRDRALKLAGVLGFVLVCLAAATGYIRADEATRGYYATPLRMAAAAAVGASGLALYRFLA